MDVSIQLKFLDHVAIRVADMEASAKWYQKVFGLKKYKLKKWGDYPVFLLANKSGIALFPANLEDEALNPDSHNVGIDHFAFQVNKENFDKALRKYKALGLDFIVKDHHYFESVYTDDPDGHTVELTYLKMDEKEFYT